MSGVTNGEETVYPSLVFLFLVGGTYTKFLLFCTKFYEIVGLVPFSVGNGVTINLLSADLRNINTLGYLFLFFF